MVGPGGIAPAPETLHVSVRGKNPRFICRAAGSRTRFAPTPRVYNNSYTTARKLKCPSPWQRTRFYGRWERPGNRSFGLRPQDDASRHFLCNDLMHLAQALTRLPEGNRTHCKFGYFLTLAVGLNLPRSLTLVTAVIDPLPQMAHCFGINSFL